MAREAPEWTYCDFGIDPKAGLLATNKWLEAGKQPGIADTLYGRPAVMVAPLPKPSMDPEPACAAALASPDLEAKDWSRRVSLLEARAAHRIAAGKFEDALRDLDAAKAAIPPNINPAEQARSLDIGMLFLRALALNGAGRSEEATRLVVAAADARPWSGQIQDIATTILRTIPGGIPASVGVADRRFKLDPSIREDRARSRQAYGDFAGATADWQLVKPAVTDSTTVFVPLRGVSVNGGRGWPMTMIDPNRVGTAALAAALAGEGPMAERWMTEARAAAAAQQQPTLPGYLAATGPMSPTIDRATHDAAFAKWQALVDAAIAWHQGRKAEAQQGLATLGEIGSEPAAIQAASLILGQPTPATLSKGKIDARLLFASLPPYEGGDVIAVSSSENPASSFLFGTPKSAKKSKRNSYSGSAGFFKAAGFKSKPMKDGAGTTVTFTGDASSSFAVEEMTLLRAADLASEAGKPRLMILDKRDFARISQATINGSARGLPVPAGFVTELDVAFTDSTDERAISVTDVITSLRPIYRPD